MTPRTTKVGVENAIELSQVVLFSLANIYTLWCLTRNVDITTSQHATKLGNSLSTARLSRVFLRTISYLEKTVRVH